MLRHAKYDTIQQFFHLSVIQVSVNSTELLNFISLYTVITYFRNYKKIRVELLNGSPHKNGLV